MGENILKYEQDVIYALRMGFDIGNHSFTHRYFSDLSLDECLEEIMKTHHLIADIYKKSRVESKKYFRFPYFDCGGDRNSKEFEEKWSKPQSDWFKYSQEEKRQKIQKHLKDNGYCQPNFQEINLKWFVDGGLLNCVDTRSTFDQMEYWLGNQSAPLGLMNSETILKRMDEDFPEDGLSLNYLDTRDIILVHDSEKTTDIFFEIINRYLKKGIVFLKPE